MRQVSVAGATSASQYQPYNCLRRVRAPSHVIDGVQGLPEQLSKVHRQLAQ